MYMYVCTNTVPLYNTYEYGTCICIVDVVEHALKLDLGRRRGTLTSMYVECGSIHTLPCTPADDLQGPGVGDSQPQLVGVAL